FRKGDCIECKKFELFLLAYFMIVIISLFGSTLFVQSFKGFIKVVIYLGFYLSLVQYLKHNKEKIWWIIYTIAACLSIEIFQGLIQTVIRPEAISTWQDTTYLNPEQIINRVYGTLKPLNPNLFGGYLVAAIPALIAAFVHFLYKNNKALYIPLSIITILSFYILLQTGCRGAYLGLFAIIIFLIAISYKLFKAEYKKAYLSFAGIISSLSILILLSVTSFRARIFSIFAMRTDSSNSFRFNVYNSCIQMFQDNWLLGIGLGNSNFREIYGLYMKTGFDALSAYNIYLETAVESGIFALLTWVSFLILVIYNAYKYITTKEFSSDVIIVIAALASIIGLIVHGFVDTVFFRPQIQFTFWTMVAIIRVQTNKIS
ncbi:O-antigen ligase family protein, partial [bacterium]|nr:O-antigen ligase family protein [bacterium]